jgi:glutamate/tyrosine decarboxylase-like PLP-dependent enzyme
VWVLIDLEEEAMDNGIEPALREAYERSRRYIDGLGERPVRPDPLAVRGLDALGGSLPEGPMDAGDVVRMLDEFGSPATMAIAGPRFFGFVMGGSLPATTAAGWLATAWDQNTGLHLPTPGTAAIEEIVHGWLLDVLGLPAETGTGFVTGGTMANFTALAAARHVLYTRAGWDVESDGMVGAPPITVVLGAEAHPTVRKSLGMLGFGRTRTVDVPVDDQGRLRADALPDVSGPALVITQAGNVNTGSFDPIADVCAWARERGAWVHVDGAFGLWAAAAPGRKHLLDGYEQADSWATDAHKWLNVPYDSGVAFVRDSDALRSAMAISAAYLPAEDRREPSHYTPELSRRARGVEVWAALRSLGRSGVAEMVDRCCVLATRFADRLGDAGYEILNDVVLNQVLVSFGDAETTQRVIAAVQEEGTCWAGGTVWQGRTAMRISVSNWATTAEDVDRSVEAMIRCARAAAG